MHACGHDLHMAAILGTAEIMARNKNTWHGTLMLIGQPAEETIGGADGMVRDGLFTRFPKPDVAVALHVGNELPAGMVSITPGIYNTNSDSMRITIYGKGGHGAMPQHGDRSHRDRGADNPYAADHRFARSEAGRNGGGHSRLHSGGDQEQHYSRSRRDGADGADPQADVRKQILAAIARIAKGEAAAGGAPREPLVERYEGTDLVYNDPALAERLRAPLEAALGKDKVVTAEPITPSEDFSYFVEQGVPGFYFSLGGADPEKFAQAKAAGTSLPSNHSPLFAPDVDPALHAGIVAEVAVLKNLLNTSPEELHKFNAEKESR